LKLLRLLGVLELARQPNVGFDPKRPFKRHPNWNPDGRLAAARPCGQSEPRTAPSPCATGGGIVDTTEAEIIWEPTAPAIAILNNRSHVTGESGWKEAAIEAD
jgi:hypothetical protein